MNCASCGKPIQLGELYSVAQNGDMCHANCPATDKVIGMGVTTFIPWKSPEEVKPDVTVGAVQ